MTPPKPTPKPAAKPAATPHHFTLTAAWAAALLALLTVLFFHDVSLGGKTFVSPDATAPVGFVRIGEQVLWQQHVYPLWNPFVFLGMPSFGSGAYNPLIYPPDWPVALVQKALPLPEMTWMLIYYFLGGLFFFLLAREWNARPEGALMGAIAFVFAPNLVAVGAHGHGSQLVDSAYLPLLVWLAARWMRRGSLADLGWLAIAGGFQFLRGHVQICFYTWIAVVLYGGVDLLASLRTPSEVGPKFGRALGLGVAAALAFGVAGFYNLPLKDYAQYSIRGGTDGSGGVGMDYATQWSMAPYELPAVVMPNFVGFGGATYWGSMPFTDYPNAFMGIVAVLLALPAFALRGRQQVYAFALGLVALLISFGSHFPLYQFLYDHLPQFKKFRIPVMVIILFQLSVALALAWGWTALLAGGGGAKATKRSTAETLLLAGGALLLLAGVIVSAGGEGLRAGYVAYAMAHKPQFDPRLASAAFDAFKGDVGRTVFLGLAAVALAWLAARGRLGAGLASVLVTALLLFSLWPISRQVMEPVIGDPVARNLEAGRDDVVDFLTQQGGWGDFRVLDVEKGNKLAGFGIGTLNGYHAAKLRLFQDLLDGPLFNSPRWLALVNARYIVLPQPMDPGQTPPFLKSVHEGSAVVYENLAVLPRATIVSGYGVLPDTGRAAIDSVAIGSRDPRNWTWLTKDPKVALGPVDGATVKVTRYTLHDVDIDVTTPGAGIVRLADQWYPDWKATVDGKPTEILRADHALRAVVVPAGHHVVTFHYDSGSVHRGFALSLGSLAVAVLLLVAGLFLGRRPAPAPAPAEGA